MADIVRGGWLAVGMLFCLASLSGAEEKAKPKAPVTGVVKSAKAGERKITLVVKPDAKSDKTEEQTFIMSFDGKVMIDKAFLSLDDLKPGTKVQLTFNAMGEIAKITEAKTETEKPKKK